MPIFEYRCSTCNEKFEELVFTRTRPKKVACPSCGGKKTEPLLSVFATQTSSSNGECFSRSAGVCEAGGGPMA